MIYLLVQSRRAWLEAHHLGFLRVFNDVAFQATVGFVLSFLLCIGFAPPWIAWLRRQKIGDLANFDEAQMNALMASKKSTPTMGGVLIIGAIVATTLLLGDLGNFYVRMALVCVVWLGCVGAVDDWLKLTASRRAAATPKPVAADLPVPLQPRPVVSRQGLTSLEKLLFQVGLAVILGYFTYGYGRHVPESHTLYVPIFKNLHWVLSLGAFVAISVLVLTGTSNAVNLTDGLDGLAAGCSGIVGFALLIFALIQESKVGVGALPLTDYLLMPHIPGSDAMAVTAGAMTGACLGFLWFNCNPARVFMGDTGSLALGGLIGYVAIVLRQELLLFLLGGIFVVEAFSVMIQVGYFKLSRRLYGEGRRVFLMAPLHHHFQKKGWTEVQVVVRFWLVGAMLAMLALATVKLR